MNTYFDNYVNGLTKKQALFAKEAVEAYLAGQKAEVKKIQSATDVYQLMRGMADYTEEVFAVVYSNNAGKVIQTKEIAKGGLTSTIVDVRVVYREALLCNATRIFAVHNHPSGSLRPSLCDDELTKNLAQAGQVLNIRMLDHVIISNEGYYSYSDEGRI